MLKFKAALQKDFEVDGDMLGPGEDEKESVSFLGRTLRFTSTGLEWEGTGRW